MANQKRQSKKSHRNLKCDICTKPQQWYAQKENLDRHMKIFHNGGQ